MSQFSVETFLSRSTEKLRRRTLLCITKFSGIEKFYGMEGGGGEDEGVSRFSVEFFWSAVSKNFVGGSFSASFISGIEKCQV